MMSWLGRARQELWQRRRPQGLIGWAYLDLLQDKIALALALEGRGIAVVATAQVVQQAPTPPPLASLLPGSHPYFCKNRSTNQGRGAFRVWHTPGGLGGLRFEGGHLTDGAAMEAAWRDLCQRDDALIQADLANHPALEGLTLPGRAITVRYISQGQGHDLKALTATLEVASYEDDTTGRVGYSLFPLQVCTGQVLPWPNASELPPAARQAHDRLWRQLHHPFHLPHWSTLVAASHNAHQIFPDVWAIAWDWVITPSGPVLLEGNSGWGTATPQIIQGGLLG